jgi:hypothetical protein
VRVDRCASFVCETPTPHLSPLPLQGERRNNGELTANEHYPTRLTRYKKVLTNLWRFSYTGLTRGLFEKTPAQSSKIPEPLHPVPTKSLLNAAFIL